MEELKKSSATVFDKLPPEFVDWLLTDLGDLVQTCFWEELKKVSTGTEAWRAFQRLIFVELRDDVKHIKAKLDVLASDQARVGAADITAAIEQALTPWHEKLDGKLGESFKALLTDIEELLAGQTTEIKEHTTSESDRVIAEFKGHVTKSPFDRILGRSHVGLVGQTAIVQRLVTSLVTPGAWEFVIAPGGYGKSAIAAETVDQLCGTLDTQPPNAPFPGGVCFVNLYERQNEVTESDFGSQQIAAAWGVDLDRHKSSEHAALPTANPTTTSPRSGRTLWI
jgi:hypothetical protein